MAAIVRTALVGPDLLVANVVSAEVGWQPGGGLVAVVSATAETGDAYDPVMGGFSAPPAKLAARRAAAVADVQAHRNAIMARGAPFAGKRVEVDDASRTNLGGLCAAALVSVVTQTPWPPEAQGWIALDNELIALPTPADALALGMSVLQWHGGLIRFARVAKDAVAAAEDPVAARDAIDWTPWEGPTGS